MKKSQYFKFSEFFKQGARQLIKVSKVVEVCQKLKDHHLENLNAARNYVGVAIIVLSGFRPVWWERLQGRSGKSLHTFKGFGAVDITCAAAFISKLKEALFLKTDYTRIAYYPKQNFFHCDKGKTPGRRRCFYEYDDELGDWRFIQFID